MEDKSEQGKRLLLIYKELLQGRMLTTDAIKKKLKEDLGADCSLRTIQRDIVLIQEFDTLVEREKRGKKYLWRYSKVNQNRFCSIDRFWNSEVLALYLLKAQLKKFSGTKIEKEALRITNKLEKVAPGEILIDNTFYWEKDYGYLDLRIYDDLIAKVINSVIGKYWVRLKYKSLIKNTVKEYDVRIMSLFFYENTLYAVTYFPKYESFEPLAVHRILSIEHIKSNEEVEPEFDCDEFIRKRFGVFGGRIKFVRLLIDKEYKKYFEGRHWHQTQKIYIDDEGNMILEMIIPLGDDFVAWILKWSEAIKVLEPMELAERVKNIHKEALAKYE